MNGFSDFWVKKFPAGVMVGFTYKKKRFCHSRKLLKKVLKKSENCPDSYLDLRKARFGFTTSQGRGGSIEGHRADTDSNQFNKQITGGR